MKLIRTAICSLALPILFGPMSAHADDRGDAERACRDRIAAEGRRDPRVDQTRYDVRGPGATLTGVVRSGADDRHRFECRLDRSGRVRGITLTRIDGDDRRPDRDRDRDSADGRRDAERACRDRIASDGRRDPQLDQTRYDARGSGATLTGVVRSGQDDRHRFECQLDRNGRVRGVSLARIGGNDSDRGHDRDRDRNRDRDRGGSRAYESLVGAHIGDAQSQLQAMGFERKSGDNWFLGATGECITVRLSGGRVADVRRADDRNCR